MSDIFAHIDISQGSVHDVTYDVLQYPHSVCKVDATAAYFTIETSPIDICQELLQRFEEEGECFSSKIVTGDETWVHDNEQEKKRVSKE